MMRLVHLAVLAILVFLPGLAHANEEQGRAHYSACMAQVDSRPKAAFDDATAWEGLGGGHPARHCALAALVALGHYFEAAQGLEKLAEQVQAGAAFKGQMLVQAAGAWIAAGDPERARAVADAALGLTPDAPDASNALMTRALLVRARALAGMGAYWEAADDLSRVLYADPRDVEALVLRGAAYRQLDALELALDDLNRALAIEPTHPEGLLERGNTHRLNGDKSAARADWQALSKAHPDGEAARRAEANLHALNSGLE